MAERVHGILGYYDGVPESIELPLLTSKALGRRTCRGSLQGAVHPLVRTVLLRTARSDPLMDDAELHPPDVELAQTMDPRRRKRRAVVAANRLGQAALSKEAFEGLLHASRLHVAQRRASKQVPTEVVEDRQRVAVHAVASLELPLEIDSPNLVGSVGV